MLELKDTPRLSDFQDYVRRMKEERGFSTTDKIYECFLLGEEVGELFKAVRKSDKRGCIATDSTTTEVEDELADIFIYLCSIANQHGIDLETAFRNKEEKNKKRTWRVAEST